MSAYILHYRVRLSKSKILLVGGILGMSDGQITTKKFTQVLMECHPTSGLTGLQRIDLCVNADE